MTEPSSVVSPTNSVGDRLAARNRSQKKQRMFQRHKAQMSSPRNTDASPASQGNLHIDTEPDSTEVPILSTPPRRSDLSSAYIQAKLASKPSSTMSQSVESPSKKKEAGAEKLDNHLQVPRRQQGGIDRHGRKSGLVKQIRAKKEKVASGIGAKNTSKTEDSDSTPKNGSCQQNEPAVEQEEDGDGHQIMRVSGADDEKESEPGTATTMDTDIPNDDSHENPSTDEAKSTNAALDTVANNAVEPQRLDSTDEEFAKKLDQFVEASKDEEKDFEDPPLLDMKSDVSAATSAFDMRSIHEYPPSNPTRDEREQQKESPDFVPVDEAFEANLATIRSPEEEEEEKKEKDPSEAIDTTWDTANPSFTDGFNPQSNEQADDSKNIDMFDTSSWGNTDADFDDVEGQFLRLMQVSAETAHSVISFAQRQVLDDVKRNLEAAGGIDQVESEAEMLRNANRKQYVKPETIQEDEPLLGARTCSSEFDEQLTIEQRLEKYNEENTSDKESVASDETDANKSDSDEGSQEPEDIQYIGQNSDSEDDMFEPSSKARSDEEMNPAFSSDVAIVAQNDVPTFAPSAAAAFRDETAPIPTNVNPDSGRNSSSQSCASSDESNTDTSSEEAKTLDDIGVPPPPPPGSKKKRGKKKKKSKQRSPKMTGASSASRNIPLIAPPPEEKLKKWEEQKMRAKNHIDSLKNSTLPQIDDPPVIMRVKEGQLFASGQTPKTSKSPSAKAHSPSNMETVFADERMAEKVALASSAAAVTFEQTLAYGSPTSLQSGPETPVASGAFKNWLQPEVSPIASRPHLAPRNFDSMPPLETMNKADLLVWLQQKVLRSEGTSHEAVAENFEVTVRLLLDDDRNFNLLCKYMSDRVNKATTELGMAQSFEDITLATVKTMETVESSESIMDERVKNYLEKKRPWLKPMELSEDSKKLSPSLLAANFVSFLYLASKLAKVESPFGGSNPFLAEIVNFSLLKSEAPKKNDPEGKLSSTPQDLIFNHPNGQVEKILNFIYKVTKISEYQAGDTAEFEEGLDDLHVDNTTRTREPATPSAGNTSRERLRRFIVPDASPGPFEQAVWSAPRIIPAILSFLGDPVAVCRIKMVNKFCHRIVSENEHMMMQDAVRVGGLNMNVRPAFWIWIALQKSSNDPASKGQAINTNEELKNVELIGQEGQWHHVIDRDVARAFGNMPPHKTGARLRTDSIVRALVTWGQNRIMRRGVKGGGEEIPLPELGQQKSKQKEKTRRSTLSSPPWECGVDTASVDSEVSQTPTDTVSDWGGVSPVASMVESINGQVEGDPESSQLNEKRTVLPKEELALNGNFLTTEMKSDLQRKLSFILHTLAATHADVGYCQGMDYVVAHLLRILQDTIRWQAVQGKLPATIASTKTLPDFSQMQHEPLSKLYAEVDKSLIVEETVFRVMDTFFTNYNLRHMYWPELRCLKTCCRVFERLIQIKLPVLADHFEHHDLKVGLFALGWFQTLFLYLPSMPSATVCHMWDIWLVERSFKIFFRVATAILFLSQPILLNHELEGMMTYLNTIPDATLLKPDILIACALNIKVTNRMLAELEAEVTAEDSAEASR